MAGFFQFCSKIAPRLVSYNGRGFDLPVLKYRAMKYGIQAGWLYQSGNKWENYQARYNSHWHCDLLEVLSDYGASSRPRLAEIAAVLGIPGKYGLDGGKVFDYFTQGKVQEIRDYCETDVVSTFLVYLRHALHTGMTTKESYNATVQQVSEFLENSPNKAHNLFLREWKKGASNHRLTIF